MKLLFFLFLLSTPILNANVLTVLNIFKTGFDILKTGIGITKIISQQNAGSVGGLEEKLAEILTDIERMITLSTTTIIQEVTLQNKLDKIENIVNELRSLLMDLKNYLLADSETDRGNYKVIFLNRFDQRVVAMIRSLPSLLTFVVPGVSSKPLKDLIPEKLNCNMTAVYEFQKFFANLLSDGSTLQLAFRALSNHTSRDIEDFWSLELQKVQKQFDSMAITCKNRFPNSAAEEVKQSLDAEILYENCKQRYTWAWCDVFYYPPMGTHQFHFHKSIQNFTFWNGASSTGRNQIMVIGDHENIVRVWNKKEINTALASKMEDFKSSISGAEDDSAALKVGNAVEKFVNDKGFLISGIVVFFDTTPLGEVSVKIDDDSPAAHVVLEGISLKYCYNNGFACTLARWELFNFNDDWKTHTGKFHVYVFPCSTSDTSESSRPECFKHTTNTASSFMISYTQLIWTLTLLYMHYELKNIS